MKTNQSLGAAGLFLKAWLSGRVGDSAVGIPENYLPQGRGEALSLISGCRILEIGLSLYSGSISSNCSKNMDATRRQSRECLFIYKEGDNQDVTQSLNAVKAMVVS